MLQARNVVNDLRSYTVTTELNGVMSQSSVDVRPRVRAYARQENITNGWTGQTYFL